MNKYKIPERAVSMTVNHLYGLSKSGQYKTVRDYMKKYGFALTADLIAHGFKPEDIEKAVNSEDIAVAHWPTKETKTDMYWAKDNVTLKKLEELAEKAVRFCYGQDVDQPIGGNFSSVGAEMGSQQLALVGLVYAREQGKLKELPEFDRGAGPFYIVKGSFSDKMLAKIMSEK